MHALLDQRPKASLGFCPTPLLNLQRLSRQLGGPRILMKRDDQSDLAPGANKTRKLKYLAVTAIAEGCETLITGGAPAPSPYAASLLNPQE